MVNYTLVPYTRASLIDFRFRLQSPPLNRDALVQDLKQATQTGRLADLYGMVAVDQGPEEHILTPFSAVFTAFPCRVRYEFGSEATVQQEFQGLDCTSPDWEPLYRGER
jgi:hypothetical protein